MMQHSFFLCKCLHPADVGAVSDRPRAIHNRPYEFYCRFCVFCNTPFPYTYCWVNTSTTPRVVSRRVGITGKLMKDRVIKGSICREIPR